MSFQPLDTSWQIVIVATAQNAALLPQTLEHVRMKSLSPRITVLAADLPAVRTLVARLQIPAEYRLPAVIEHGCYWKSVLAGHQFQGLRTIFLMAGACVPEHWDARLVAAGQRTKDAVAVAPQCVRHPITSIFASSDHDPKLTVEEVDQWLNDFSGGIEFTIPVIPESCALLQGEYWQRKEVSCRDDQQFFNALKLHGEYIVATDQVFIDDSDLAYTRDISLLPPATQAAYALRHPLANIRHAITELSCRAERPPQIKHCLPVVLHVSHSWGGGLSRWIQNFIEADESHNHMVLMSIGDRTAFGQQIALYSGAEKRVPLRTWTLCEPITSVVITQYEYRRLIQEVAQEFAVESIIISSLIGHSMDLLQLEVPVTYVLHDFFPYCPALYATHGNPCTSCNANELHNCAKFNPLNSYFKSEPDEHWLQVRACFLARIKARQAVLISPSPSVVARYQALENALQYEQIHVIEHGLSRDLVNNLMDTRERLKPNWEDRLRIVILGRLAPEKGSRILAELIEELGSFSHIWLLGAGENGQQFEEMPNVTVIESYSASDLGTQLASISPHLGLLLSIVPETFSYTLSELWAAGIPVLATRLGAFSDRIIDGENGWLAPINADHILARIKQLNADRTSLASVRARILQHAPRQASEMVRDYQLCQPTLGYIPLARYFLPRRTHLNPYRQAEYQAPNSVLFIDRQATYRSVLREFLAYSMHKIENSPRLSASLRNILKRIMSFCVSALSVKKVEG